MKLSIVIPVYQVEKSLPRCLESIISQSFRDWQLILVDDASTDASLAVCNKYGRGDSRIKIVRHQKNLGLSAARNTGIKRAAGEYITFVDSDDALAPDTLKNVMEELGIHGDYDILEYPVYEHYGSSRQKLLRFPKREYTDMQEYWLAGRAYAHTYAWSKIYRRKLFSNITFPEGKNFEDVWTLPKLLRLCHTVATTDVGLYYYYDNPDGITRKAGFEDFKSHLDAHLNVVSDLYPTPNGKKFADSLDSYFADYYASVLNLLLDVGDTTAEPVGRLPYVGKDGTFPILPYSQTLKLKLLHLLGSKRLCQLHRIFRHRH